MICNFGTQEQLAGKGSIKRSHSVLIGVFGPLSQRIGLRFFTVHSFSCVLALGSSISAALKPAFERAQVRGSYVYGLELFLRGVHTSLILPAGRLLG